VPRRPEPDGKLGALAAGCLEMLPWAATASPPRTPAAASFVPPQPDNGSGCDYEDDGPEQRRASRFSSPSSSSRLEAAAQQEQASGEVLVD